MGPRPFSEEWLNSPQEPLKAPIRAGLPAWLPSETVLASILVLLLVLISVPWRHSGGVNAPQDQSSISGAPASTATFAPDIAQLQPAEAVAPGGATQAAEGSSLSPTATQTAETPANSAASTVAVAPPETPGGILPTYRVLSFYGFPGDENMGILGEYSMSALLEQLQAQAAEYEAIDPSIPYMLAFEVIASVAQNWPGDDGDYLASISDETLQQYVDFTAENGLLLILDMQFGHRTVAEEIASVENYLMYPNVHLALDPEFAVSEGEVPGTVFGQIDASDVLYAQTELARISAENDLPPKMLIVHQFTQDSITNKSAIAPVAGVQFVLEVDGYGTPDEKRATFDLVTGGENFDYHGFKLWYKQDDPLMTPAEVIALKPSPDLIIYQ